MYKMGSKANCGSVRKGSWTDEEDNLLRNCIQKHGEGNWHRVPIRAGLNRCRKSCRLRWMNYLKPNIKRGQFNEDEVDLIIRLHKLLGNRWSLIAGRIPGRTANDVKNYWNTHLLKKMCPNPKQPNNYNNNNVCSKTAAATTTRSSTTTTTTTKKEGSNTASGIIIKPHAWSFAKQYGGGGGRSVVVSKSSSSVIENSEEEEDEEEEEEEDDKWWEKLVDIYEEKEKGKDDTNNNNNNDNDDDEQHILHTAYSSWDDHLLWNLDLNVWDS